MADKPAFSGASPYQTAKTVPKEELSEKASSHRFKLLISGGKKVDMRILRYHCPKGLKSKVCQKEHTALEKRLHLTLRTYVIISLKPR